MPYRKFLFGNNQYFHLYNRGNNHGKIFFERENYAYFLRLIRNHIPEEKTDVVAYCLMPTHYHVLGYTKSDGFQGKCSLFCWLTQRQSTSASNEQARYFKEDSKPKW